MFLSCLLASFFVTNAAVEPQKCCVDRQFEALLGEFGGALLPGKNTPTALDGFNLMSYDYYAKMMRLEAHMNQPDGTVQVTNVIIDYKAGKEYVKTDTGCTVLDTTETMREPCVPAISRFLGNTSFGYGDTTLKVNTWQYQKPGSDNVVNLVVTADGCVPMVEASYGTMNNAKTDVVYFITSFQPGIKDRSVFTIPTNCQQGGSTVGVVGRAVRALKDLF
ncbi:ependymin-related protein 1-like [Haliotis cracherodii]|uniref:ependymin-related protein 1-like n=1 Tax=Haliotis cracherodii TaxID=6455 RepID=UPI0039ECED95